MVLNYKSRQETGKHLKASHAPGPSMKCSEVGSMNSSNRHMALLSGLPHGHKTAAVLQPSRLPSSGKGTWQQVSKPFRGL